MPSQEALLAALAKVNDPEIRKPITELGMVESVTCDEAGLARVTILLTISGCPLKDTLTKDSTAALLTVPGVTDVEVTLGVMSDEQRTELKSRLRGGAPEREIPFAKPGSLTRVYAVASGKGGVGKSSVTANLAAAMAEQGDVSGAAVGQAAGREEIGQCRDVDRCTRLCRAARVGDIGGVTDRAVIDRSDAATRKGQCRACHRQAAHRPHLPTTLSGRSSPNTR